MGLSKEESEAKTNALRDLGLSPDASIDEAIAALSAREELIRQQIVSELRLPSDTPYTDALRAAGYRQIAGALEGLGIGNSKRRNN
jgi:hypothetical protein